MSRANSKNMSRHFYEWEKGIMSNQGVSTPIPYSELFHYLNQKNVIKTLDLFFDNSIKEITFFDLCAMQQFWWINTTITAARYSQINHPKHYSGEFVFDQESLNQRTIIEVRQPDLDGKHWVAKHIHLKRGSIHPTETYRIDKPTFNEHIKLLHIQFNGFYAVKIF